jgi:hypothetical protein
VDASGWYHAREYKGECCGAEEAKVQLTLAAGSTDRFQCADFRDTTSSVSV